MRNNTIELIAKLQEAASVLPQELVDKVIYEIEKNTDFVIPRQLQHITSAFCMAHVKDAISDQQATREMKIFSLAILVGYEEARRG